jgi:hypothetical protein
MPPKLRGLPISVQSNYVRHSTALDSFISHPQTQHTQRGDTYPGAYPHDAIPPVKRVPAYPPSRPLPHKLICLSFVFSRRDAQCHVQYVDNARLNHHPYDSCLHLSKYTPLLPTRISCPKRASSGIPPSCASLIDMARVILVSQASGVLAWPSRWW